MRLPVVSVVICSVAVSAIGALGCGGSTQGATPPEPDAGQTTAPLLDAGPHRDAAPDVHAVLDAGPHKEAAAEAAVDAAPDVDRGAPSTTYPAPHPPLPQLVNVAGGSTLAHPKLFLVFYPGYAYEAQLVELAQKLGVSTQWGGSTAEYGVGAVEYAGMRELSGADATPPTTIADSEVASFLSARIASGAFGPPDPNAIYTIFYPETTTITSTGPTGAISSCQPGGFGGYHDDMSVTFTRTAPDAGADAAAEGGAGVQLTNNFAFAVLPTCAASNGLSILDGVSAAVSHEWVEAATDPFPSTNNGNDSAYVQVDNDHIAWMLLGGGGEAGDLCVPEANAFYVPADLPSTVQRTWSNDLARASHDPCALDQPGSFFNSAPVLGETISFDSQFLGPVTTKGVTIPVGKSRTIEVDLFSDGPVSGPWTVAAQDLLSDFTGSAPTLEFSWDRAQGVNGEKLHLTITTATASTLLGGGHPFVITSTLGGIVNTWPAFIVE